MPVRFRDLPLQAKFLVCLAVFFLLPLVTVAVLINLQAHGTIRTNVRQTQMQVLKQTKPMLEALVRDTELISLTLLSDEKMQAMIRYHLGEEPAVPSGLTQEQRAYDFQVSFQPLMASRSAFRN